MKRRNFLSALAVAALASTQAALADPIAYNIVVDTSSLSGPGYIEFQFNQANALTSLSATATLSNFSFNGFTLDPGSSGGTAGVTGSPWAPPVSIPNDAGGINYYDIAVTNWGSSFGFTLLITGPAVGGSAPDGSGFYLFLLDAGFAPIIAPLGSGEIANVIINPDGTNTPTGSGSAAISAVPEPGTVGLTAAAVLGALALARRRSRL